MSFVYPLFIIATAAIAVPVIIHLFNFRKYKKVFFPDIRFLKELQEQTQRHSRLKHLLVLAARILTILFLVFAFAQPFFNKDKDKINQVPRAVSIYIDNSFSMGVEKNSLSMLDLAKDKAKDLIASYGDNDKIQVLTNDFGYNENKFLTRNEALRFLSTIQLSAKNKQPRQIIEKQKQLIGMEGAYQKQIIYISDFQKSNFPAELTTNDSIRKYFISVNAAALNNISLDTAWFESPSILLNEPNPIQVKLKNNSAEEVNTSLTLRVNNQLKSVVNTRLKARETLVQPIAFSPKGAGTQNVELFINDHPMNFDDTFYIAGKVNANYAVLTLNQTNANAYLSSVFKPGIQFKVDHFQIGGVNTALFANYSLIILNSITQMSEPVADALTQYLNNGGSILCFAPENQQLAGINSFLSQSAGCSYSGFDTTKLFVTAFNRSHELFRDLFVKTPENIDLPVSYKHFHLGANAMSSEQKLFTFSNGDAFLSMFKTGNGKLYVCASSAESNASSFPKSYWFLPLIYKMAFSSGSNAINALTINKHPDVLVENNKLSDKTIYHLLRGNFDAIPEQRAMGNKMLININNAINQAGFYTLRLPENKDTATIAVNYDRSESALEYWTMDELKKSTRLKNAAWLGERTDIAAYINEWQHGMPLWKVCIILALLFLLTEILLIRLMK